MGGGLVGEEGLTRPSLFVAAQPPAANVVVTTNSNPLLRVMISRFPS